MGRRPSVVRMKSRLVTTAVANPNSNPVKVLV
jgi:hypothetical protein